MAQALQSTTTNSDRREGSAGPTTDHKVSTTKQMNKPTAQRRSHWDDGTWIEDPQQRQIVLYQACQQGNAEYLQPLLECLDEYPHPQDLSISDMLHIAIEARNVSIICFLLKLAERDGSQIDLSLRNAAFNAGFAVFKLFPKTVTESRVIFNTAECPYQMHPTNLANTEVLGSVA